MNLILLDLAINQPKLFKKCLKAKSKKSKNRK